MTIRGFLLPYPGGKPEQKPSIVRPAPASTSSIFTLSCCDATLFSCCGGHRQDQQSFEEARRGNLPGAIALGQAGRLPGSSPTAPPEDRPGQRKTSSASVQVVLEPHVVVEVVEVVGTVVRRKAFDQTLRTQADLHVVALRAGAGQPELVLDDVELGSRVASSRPVRGWGEGYKKSVDKWGFASFVSMRLGHLKGAGLHFQSVLVLIDLS